MKKKEQKSKSILRRYDLVTWPVNLIVAIGDKKKEINDSFKPADDEFDIIGEPCSTGATTYVVKDKKTDERCLLVWFPDKENVCTETIAHEAGHVALEIFFFTDSKVHFDNQEPFCYLLGSVARLMVSTACELMKNKK